MKGSALAVGVYTASLLRSLLAAAMVVPVWLATGFSWPRGTRLRLHLERGVVSAFMALSWFFALTRLPVAEAMLKDPVAAGVNMQMDELRRLMVENHQRYLPVMDDTTLMGVVSFHDVARAVLEEQSFENRMLKNYIRNWPAEEDAV